MGFGGWGLGFGVWGLAFRVGLPIGLQGLGPPREMWQLASQGLRRSLLRAAGTRVVIRVLRSSHVHTLHGITSTGGDGAPFDPKLGIFI